MALKIGNNAVTGAYLGANQVRRAYKGGTLVYQGFSPASEQEFIQQTAAGGPAQLLKVYGKSVVWNQMVSFDTNTDGFKVGAAATITAQSDGTYLVNYGGGSTFSIVSKHNGEANHKYLIRAKIKLLSATADNVVGVSQSNNVGNTSSSVGNSRILFDKTTTDWQTQATIATANDSGFCYAAISQQNLSGTISDYYLGAWVFTDLTLLYGAGNEPTSVAAFLADYPTFDPTYDPGSLQSNKTAELRAERIPVINVWDEEWEVGALDTTTGVNTNSTISFRSKNFIKVVPGSQYYAKSVDSTNQHAMWLLCYDSNYNVIATPDIGGIQTSANATKVDDHTFTVPLNCEYVRFYETFINYEAYANDICINLSDPAINGTYFPHWRGSLALNLSTLTGKLNGEGASVVVYPDGLRGVGTDRDAAYGSTGEVARAVVDLGTLNYGKSALGTYAFYTTGLATVILKNSPNLLCPIFQVGNVSGSASGTMTYDSNGVLYFALSPYTDPAAFKAAMSGVMLDYPLATPLTYTLDTPLPTDLDVRAGDKMIAESDNNCPFVGEMKFGL